MCSYNRLLSTDKDRQERVFLARCRIISRAKKGKVDSFTDQSEKLIPTQLQSYFVRQKCESVSLLPGNRCDALNIIEHSQEII